MEGCNPEYLEQIPHNARGKNGDGCVPTKQVLHKTQAEVEYDGDAQTVGDKTSKKRKLVKAPSSSTETVIPKIPRKNISRPKDSHSYTTEGSREKFPVQLQSITSTSSFIEPPTNIGALSHQGSPGIPQVHIEDDSSNLKSLQEFNETQATDEDSQGTKPTTNEKRKAAKSRWSNEWPAETMKTYKNASITKANRTKLVQVPRKKPIFQLRSIANPVVTDPQAPVDAFSLSSNSHHQANNWSNSLILRPSFDLNEASAKAQDGFGFGQSNTSTSRPWYSSQRPQQQMFAARSFHMKPHQETDFLNAFPGSNINFPAAASARSGAFPSQLARRYPQQPSNAYMHTTQVPQTYTNSSSHGFPTQQQFTAGEFSMPHNFEGHRSFSNGQPPLAAPFYERQVHAPNLFPNRYSMNPHAQISISRHVNIPAVSNFRNPPYMAPNQYSSQSNNIGYVNQIPQQIQKNRSYSTLTTGFVEHEVEGYEAPVANSNAGYTSTTENEAFDVRYDRNISAFRDAAREPSGSPPLSLLPRVGLWRSSQSQKFQVYEDREIDNTFQAGSASSIDGGHTLTMGPRASSNIWRHKVKIPHPNSTLPVSTFINLPGFI